MCVPYGGHAGGLCECVADGREETLVAHNRRLWVIFCVLAQAVARPLCNHWLV